MRAANIRKGRWNKAIAWGAIVFVLLLWYVLTTGTKIVGPARFPSPAEFGHALQQIALSGYADAKLHQHILQSCKLVLMGFAAAISIGVPLGLLQLGDEVKSPLVIGALARELFGLATPMGRAEQDCTAMLLMLEDLAGVSRAKGQSGG